MVLPSAALAYVDGPVADRDGGGALTCRDCHFHDEQLAHSGAITVKGLPDRYEPGGVYRLVLKLSHPEMKRGGFQMSVRNGEGRQAGDLETGGGHIKIAPDPDSGVTFAQHSKDGALFTGVNASWSVLWSAPKTLSPVTIYAAGNASNGDDSALGDVILLFERTIEPIS